MIDLNCKLCDVQYEVERIREIHYDALSIECNWCPNCEPQGTGYYSETLIYAKEKKEVQVEFIDPDQLTIFDCGA